MPTINPQLPGQGSKPQVWVPPPKARSWEELAATFPGGIAVLDRAERLVFVSDRFLSAVASPTALTGLPVRGVLPDLAQDDPRQLSQQLAEGQRIEFEQQFASVDGDGWCFCITIVPSSELDGDLTAVVFATDITVASNKSAQLREATISLTQVENDWQYQLRQDVHDELIQLLAALAMRLGMVDTEDAKSLQKLVSEAANTLRNVIEQFSPQLDQASESLLERSIAPMIADTGIEVHVNDRRANVFGLAEEQAAFVLLYQIVRSVRDSAVLRPVTVELRDEQGGQRIHFSLPSFQPKQLLGGRALRLRAAVAHARSLGGTLDHALDANNIRRFSMWIPRLTRSADQGSPRIPPPPADTGRRVVRPVTPASLAPLNDSAWLEIVGGAPQPMAEFDAGMRVNFANNEMNRAFDSNPDETIRTIADALLDVGDIPDLDEVNRQLEAGEFVKVYWVRPDTTGDMRQIYLSLSPRLEADGTWAGLLGAMDDRTDVQLLDELNEAALADLTLSRRLAIESSVRNLEEPLSRCHELIDRIEAFERTCDEPEAISIIRRALTQSVQQFRTASSAFTHSSLTTDSLAGTLIDSLGTLIESRKLIVEIDVAAPPSSQLLDVAFRIAREAAVNAVIHGNANVINVTLSGEDDGISCTIHDDGAALDIDLLQSEPGLEGMRTMKERAQAWGGTCDISRHPVAGTLVSLWLPERSQA